MVGRIRGISYPTGKLVRFGYVNVIPMSETCKKEWLPEGTSLRGHEFHYWDSTENGEDCMAVKPDGKRSWSCIHAEPGLFCGISSFILSIEPGMDRKFSKVQVK